MISLSTLVWMSRDPCRCTVMFSHSIRASICVRLAPCPARPLTLTPSTLVRDVEYRSSRSWAWAKVPLLIRYFPRVLPTMTPTINA